MGKRILVYALCLGGEKEEKADMKGAIKRKIHRSGKALLVTALARHKGFGADRGKARESA